MRIRTGVDKTSGSWQALFFHGGLGSGTPFRSPLLSSLVEHITEPINEAHGSAWHPRGSGDGRNASWSCSNNIGVARGKAKRRGEQHAHYYVGSLFFTSAKACAQNTKLK